MDPENYSGEGRMRDNFVCQEGGLVQMPINGNFTMKIVLFEFYKGGRGLRVVIPTLLDPHMKIKPNQTEICQQFKKAVQ